MIYIIPPAYLQFLNGSSPPQQYLALQQERKTTEENLAASDALARNAQQQIDELRSQVDSSRDAEALWQLRLCVEYCSLQIRGLDEIVGT